jgi:hypothetical protein
MNHSLITLTSLLILLTSFQAFSFQTIDELLADPDITWIGEVYVDYHPNVNIIDPENEEIKNRHETIDYNAIDILKTKRQVSDDQLGFIPNLLSQKVFQLNSNALTVYKDADLEEKLNYEAYQKIIHQEVSETNIHSDPETFEQIISVVKSELNASHIEQFRLKQILSYNAKTNQLNITPIAIAPLQSINKFITREEVALFWMPIKEAFQIINLDHSSINWAKRFHKDIFSDSIQIIKGTEDLSNIFMAMIVKYRANSSTAEVYQIEEDKQLVVLTPETIKKIGLVEDIVVTFDPKTYEEIITILNNDFTAKDLKKIRITQDWVWDDKTQAMQVRVVGFSPMTYRPDKNGSYMLDPFCYIKAKK